MHVAIDTEQLGRMAMGVLEDLKEPSIPQGAVTDGAFEKFLGRTAEILDPRPDGEKTKDTAVRCALQGENGIVSVWAGSQMLLANGDEELGKQLHKVARDASLVKCPPGPPVDDTARSGERIAGAMLDRFGDWLNTP